jgi:hypothetical protein
LNLHLHYEDPAVGADTLGDRKPARLLVRAQRLSMQEKISIFSELIKPRVRSGLVPAV